ncbi:MAG: OsmC family protein [Hyphomonas sp.]|nr:OsmC family protein [Hyphomonas sp.]
MENQTTPAPMKNGVNVEALLHARSVLEGAPQAADFTWKASSEWKGGTHTRTEINGFFGLGEDHQRKQTFVSETDHPEVFAAPDQAPTPVELILSGLAGCLVAGVASVAENRGIQLNSVKATIEGNMNLYGILGIDSATRNGFSAVRVHFDIDADASHEDIQALVAQSQKRSAVFDIITNPTNVFVDVAF